MPNPQQLLVVLCGLAFTVVGVWTVVDPVGPLADVGLAPIDDRGLVEIRAMYGGLELGFAAFFGWSLSSPERTHAALMAGTLGIGGLGLFRLLGMLTLGPPSTLMWGLCALELGAAAAGAAGLRWGGRP